MSISRFKSVLFDLDGVLISTKDLHYEAFTKSLQEQTGHQISKSYHDQFLCGLPTMEKLKKLQIQHGFSDDVLMRTFARKQEITSSLFPDLDLYSHDTVEVIRALKVRGMKIGVCSNTVRETLDLALKKLGIINDIDLSLSSNDVQSPKPSPEIYLKAMSILGVNPSETIILEDSKPGIEAARLSGGTVVVIESPKDVTWALLQSFFPVQAS